MDTQRLHSARFGYKVRLFVATMWALYQTTTPHPVFAAPPKYGAPETPVSATGQTQLPDPSPGLPSFDPTAQCAYTAISIDQLGPHGSVASVVSSIVNGAPQCLVVAYSEARKTCAHQYTSGANGGPAGTWDDCIVDHMRDHVSLPWFNTPFYFDENCKLLINHPSQGVDCEVHMQLLSSPISLIWTPGFDIESEVTLVSFPLELGAVNRSYLWKASSNAPLLVYDPTHRGVIESASQLFGNWSFGGQRTAGLADGPLPRSWNNGYEALSTLDQDRNGKIDGAELEPIGLWFDDNRDGVSQQGEVRRIMDEGVIALYTTPDRLERETNNLYATLGYERIVNGKVVRGSSVDWHSPSSGSATDLISSYQLSRIDKPYTEQSDSTDANSATASSPAARSGLGGIWRWTPGQVDAVDAGSAGGLLYIKELSDGRLEGFSSVEMRVRPTGDGVSALRKNFSLRGRTGETSGAAFIETLSDGRVLSSSTVTKSSTGLLRGETTIKSRINGRQSSLQYRWTARKLTPSDAF